jgi:two-component system, NarL family, response regulator LiaR
MDNTIKELSSIKSIKSKIKVLVADDHPLLRQALRNLLEKNRDINIIAEACDGEEAYRLAMKLMPNVIIMDIAMPLMNGLEATRRIKAELPSIAIMVLTVHDDLDDILGILKAGAAGYLIKDVFGDEVVNAIRMVSSGKRILSASVFDELLKNVRYPCSYNLGSIQSNAETLTIRELEIIKLVARGVGNKEIADTLNISSNTVKAYLVNIFSKLRVNSRTEAVIIGLKNGLFTTNEIE